MFQVKFNWLNYEIYGFPQDGNDGVSTYYLQARLKSGGGVKTESYKIFIQVLNETYLHEIKLCTTMSFRVYNNHLETRYELAKILARYLLDTEVMNLRIRRYDSGCIYFSFIHLDDVDTCNHDKMKVIQSQLYGEDNDIKEEFRLALKGITVIKSVNLTLLGDCIFVPTPPPKTNLEWVKTAAPILILGAIILIPVAISCYVCRGVRKRQIAMQHILDKKLKVSLFIRSL